METYQRVSFVQQAEVRHEGKEPRIYEPGTEHVLRSDIAAYWARMDKAILVGDLLTYEQYLRSLGSAIETQAYGDGTVATGLAPLPGQSPDEQESDHADTVESAKDVGGADGTDPGVGAKPIEADKPAGNRGGGRRSSNRGK